MEDSILKSTKKILGIADDYTAFDLDILIHINSTFSILTQMGIPIEGFVVEDDVLKWSDLALPQDQLGMIRTYVFLKVRLLFDPPATSFLIDAMKNQINEFETRINYLREDLIPLRDLEEPIELAPPSPDGNLSASGVQLTAVSVWIMDHNLGYSPAGLVFHTLDGETEIEPQEITYVNNNRTLASWPTPTAGRWIAS